MSDRLTRTDVIESLDRQGLLEAAAGPGVYALRVETPDSVEAVSRAFLDSVDATPRDGVVEQLTSDRVAYVGASQQVRDRVTDHADGEVRQATFLEAFAPVAVIDVWSHSQPFTAEYNHAVELSNAGWTCWMDGEVL